jgi:short-subunit dehydrogenase
MIALVTGATEGIGRAIVERMAPDCSELHLVARTKEKLNAVAEAIGRPGLEVRVWPCDLSEASQVEAMLAELKKDLGRLDLLVNNAGVYLPGQITSEPLDQLGYMMRLNVLSHYAMVRGLQAHFGPGTHIFHMASVASRKMFADKPSYSVTKHAQLALVDALRNEFRSQGIKVTAILPGPTWSASWAGVDLPTERLLPAVAVADQVWHAYRTATNVVIEEIVIRPMEGDLD